MDNEYFTLVQASDQLNISARALRQLCNSGLVPQVRRDQHRHRILAGWQLDHIKVLLQLKAAGMGKTELKRYVKLFRQGPQTSTQRKALLETWRRQLWQELAVRQKGIDLIERQIELIDQQK